MNRSELDNADNTTASNSVQVLSMQIPYWMSFDRSHYGPLVLLEYGHFKRMNSSTSHSAPGQAAGYFFQIERAMARLAEADADAQIAVEKEDDVSVKFSDGSFYLEQDKHTVGERCPFTDNSKALWNTLDIWTSLAESNEIPPSECRYFLVTNVQIPDGLARSIGDADPDTVEECLVQLQKVAGNAPFTVKAIVDRVMKRDRNLLTSVILNIECIDSSAASSGVALRRKIASNLHLPDDVDEIDVLHLLHGWIASELLTLWREKKPGLISRRAFDRQLHRHIEQFRKHKQYGLPEHLVPFAKEELQRHRKRRYVKQVAIVSDEAGEALEAITDFVRCSTERFRLADEGALTFDDWKAFEDDLHRSWKNIFRRETRLRNDEEESQVGYKIWCDVRDVKADLGGDSAHRYIVMGTYHRFSDDKQVGWHPRYQELVR